MGRRRNPKTAFICGPCRRADREQRTHPGALHPPGICDCRCEMSDIPYLLHHGTHRPDRCCRRCHALNLAMGAIESTPGHFPSEFGPPADEASYARPAWRPDRGVTRTTAARIRASEMAGDPW